MVSIPRTALLSCLLATGLPAQPFEPDQRTLLLDHLDQSFTPDGKLTTTPAVIKAQAEFAGGRPSKGCSFVPGKYGQGLRFHEFSTLDYPAAGNLELAAGAIEFDVKLAFDAVATSAKPPSELRNQLFVTFFGPGTSKVMVYTTLKNTCVGVWDTKRQLICYGGFPTQWHQDEWHHLELRWGRALELWCDGKQAIDKPWFGLFGPVDAQPDNVRIRFGSHPGSSNVVSEFTLDEIRLLGPGGEQVPDYPTLTVPRLQAPTLDGNPSEAEWAGAARTTGFVGLQDHALVEDQTAVYLGYDDEALYVAADCRDPQARPIVAQTTQRDGAVYMEDALDLFLEPGPDVYPYYQLIANAAGTRYDSRCDPTQAARHDTGFNPDWTVKTHREAGRWTLEAKIPFAALNRSTPKAGERWRANFCRDADAATRLSSWAFTAGNFHRPEAFGELVFGGERALRLTLEPGWAGGKVQGSLTLTGLSFQPLVTVRTRLLGGDGKAVVETENRLADYRAVTLTAPPLVTGLYQYVITATTPDQTMFYQRLPLRVAKAYDIEVAGYPYEGLLEITANVTGLANPPAGLVARSELRQGTKVFGTCETSEFTHGRGSAELDLSNLPPGSYTVHSQAVAGGQVLGQAEAVFEQQPRPSWWRSTAGLDHSVPEPWQPVKSEAKAEAVLGRRYAYGNGLLPSQITSQGQALLAAPVALTLTCDGQTSDLAGLAGKLTEQHDDAVTWVATGQVGPAKLKLTRRTEFDGLQYYTLTLDPTQPCTVDALSLAVPINGQVAHFLLPSNGRSASALELGDGPWRSPFVPQVWAGNDDVGLAWFAESDQFWTPRDDTMLEVARQGARATLTCGIVRQPRKLTGPISYSFGLMATPTKDAHAGDPFYYRFAGPVSAPDEMTDANHSVQFMEFCRYPAAHNVDPQQGTLEFQLRGALGRGGAWREVVNLTSPNGALQLSWQDANPSTLLLELRNGQESRRLTVRPVELPADGWTPLALTWTASQTSLFVGGKQVGQVDLGLPRPLSDLRFGCRLDTTGDTRIAIDELRVSRSVRYTGGYATATAPFSPDAETLLLDHLDAPFVPDGEDASTRPTVIAKRSAEVGGIPTLGCQFVPGRFGQALQIAVANPRDSVTFLKAVGSNAWLWWWWFENPPMKVGWPPPLFVEPTRGDDRPPLQTLRELGVRSVPYMAYTGIGAPSDVSRQFGAEWRRMPLSSQPSEPPKGHYFLDCCGRSGFADYLAAGTEWLLDDLGFQGCYTDGNAHAYPCTNEHHGCGYVDDAGVRRPTWPILGTREYLKRMYRLIHRPETAGYFVNHVSYNILIPTMSFTDVYYTGEHENYEDLLKFRVRWQGKQWGFWTTLLGGDSHSYESLHMAWCLLHGVSVWPQGNRGRNDMLRKTANLWQHYDRFGYRETTWIPYYRAERLAKPDHEQVKVSLYQHPSGRCLLVIGNLAHEPVTTTIEFDPGQLGLEGKQARNLLSGLPLQLDGKRLTVRVRASSFVLAELD